MKKRLGLVLLTVVVACFALFGLSACGGAEGGQLQMNKKYINSSHVSREAGKQTYYLFNSDGTGEFRYYYNSSVAEWSEDYTVKFKYIYADEDKSAVVCFFDSVTYGSNQGAEGDTVGSTWTQLLTVSKNVLCFAGTSGYSFYINQDYLKTIPNFGS